MTQSKLDGVKTFNEGRVKHLLLCPRTRLSRTGLGGGSIILGSASIGSKRTEVPTVEVGEIS